MNRATFNTVLILEDLYREQLDSKLASDLYYDFITEPDDATICLALVKAYE